MRPLVICSLFVAAASLLAIAGPVVADNKKTIDLAWRVPKRIYLQYTSVRAEQLAHKQKIVAPDKEPEAINGPMHCFGYHLGPDGAFLLDGVPTGFADNLMQIAFCTPGKPEKFGAKWEKHWDFTKSGNSWSTDEYQSTYELLPVEKYDGRDCAVIRSSHKLASKLGRSNALFSALTIDCTAYFDAATSRMRGMAFEVHGFGVWDSIKYIVDWALEWRLVTEFDSNDEITLKTKVDAAIAAGAEYLLRTQNPQYMWDFFGTHLRGQTALCLLALITCDIGPTDERLVKAFEAMDKQPFDDTYSVGLSLMAYEAKYITQDERRAFLEDRKVKEFKRDVSDRDKKEMQRLLRWLLDQQNTLNPAWNYFRGANKSLERYDLSNTQYALLGMCAAQRCGIDVPADVVHKFGDFLRTLQEQFGPEVKRVIAADPPKPVKPTRTSATRDGEPRYTRAPKAVTARGWDYGSKAVKPGAAYGSMTSSGITCMCICLEIARNLDPRISAREWGNTFNQWIEQGKQSVESGLAWHEVNFSVVRNVNHGMDWYYYYLYGIERVGMLCDVRYLGEHDWYDEGATVLVHLQKPDGSWPNGNGVASDTAFALLFLKRGTVQLKQKPVITGGDDK